MNQNVSIGAALTTNASRREVESRRFPLWALILVAFAALVLHHVAVRRWSASGPVVRALQHRPQRLQLLFLPAMHGFGIWRWRCLRSEFFRDAVFGRQGRAQELPAPLLRDCSFEPGVARLRLTERPGGHRTAVPQSP